MIEHKCILLFFTTLFSATIAGYAGSYAGNYVGGGGSSGGYGYGYGGNAPPGYPVQFFQQIPFDFNSLFAGGGKVLAYTSVSLDPPFTGKVTAHSHITFHGLNQLQSHIQQAAAAGAGGGGYSYAGSYPSYTPSSVVSGVYPPVSQSVPQTIHYGNGHQGENGAYGYSGSGSYGGGYGGGYAGSYGSAIPSGGAGNVNYGPTGNVPAGYGGPGGYAAGASATLGSNGVHQTAFLNPENPANPNIDVRFDGNGGANGDGKSFGVFTSSSSSSANVNGKPYHHRQASTSVNNNGKVTTYTVHDKK